MKKFLFKNLRKKNLLVIFVTISFLILPVILFLSGGEVFAFDTGLDKTAGAAGIQNQTEISSIIGNIIYTILGFLGVVFIILLIYGGFLRMTAQGEATKVQKSNGIIVSAIIGVLIILASYTITAFVLSNIEASVGGGDDGGQYGDGFIQPGCCAVDDQAGFVPGLIICYENEMPDSCDQRCDGLANANCSWVPGDCSSRSECSP